MKRTLARLVGAATAAVAILLPLPASASPSSHAGAATLLAAASPTGVAAPAAPSRGRIVSIAKSQLGYREHGTNCTKYGPCEEWCALFTTWVWQHAGVHIPSYAFTGDVYRWGQRHHLAYGKQALSRAKPGDVLLFGTGPANTRTSTHIGLVEKVAGHRVTLIEGNSANMVRRRSYTLSGHTFYGGVRP